MNFRSRISMFNLVLLFIFGIVSACLNMECETRILTRKCSPTKEFQAIYLSTDCGATTTPSYGVRLISNCDSKAKGIPEKTVVGSGRQFTFRWSSSDTLLIEGADTTNGYSMKNIIDFPELNRIIYVIYGQGELGNQQ